MSNEQKVRQLTTS